MNNTEQAPTAPLCNPFGQVYDFQSLAEWIAYVATCKSAGALNEANRRLRLTDGCFQSVAPFRQGDPDYKAANNAIWRRADKIEAKFSKVSWRFVDK